MKVEKLENDGCAAGADEALGAIDGRQVRGRVGLWWRDVPVWDRGRIGTIGAFQADDESAAVELLEAACGRLQELGCVLAVGPMDGNTWRRHRFVVGGEDRPPFFLEPWNPPEWPRWWERAGFGVLSQYSSSCLEIGPQATDDRMRRTEDRLAAQGVTLRCLDAERFDDELRAIHGVSLAAFADNFLYTPLAASEFLAMYGKVRRLIRPEHVWLAEREEEVCGFVFGMPDMLAVERGESPAFIVKTLAVRPDRRVSGLGSLLVARVQQAAAESGFRQAIHALQHESNTSLRITGRFGGRVFRRYALFSKML